MYILIFHFLPSPEHLVPGVGAQSFCPMLLCSSILPLKNAPFSGAGKADGKGVTGFLYGATGTGTDEVNYQGGPGDMKFLMQWGFFLF
jgi:hypothetical protein